MANTLVCFSLLHILRLLVVSLQLTVHLVLCWYARTEFSSTSVAVKTLFPRRCCWSRLLLTANTLANRLKHSRFQSCRPQSRSRQRSLETSHASASHHRPTMRNFWLQQYISRPKNIVVGILVVILVVARLLTILFKGPTHGQATLILGSSSLRGSMVARVAGTRAHSPSKIPMGLWGRIVG